MTSNYNHELSYNFLITKLFHIENIFRKIQMYFFRIANTIEI